MSRILKITLLIPYLFTSLTNAASLKTYLTKHQKSKTISFYDFAKKLKEFDLENHFTKLEVNYKDPYKFTFKKAEIIRSINIKVDVNHTSKINSILNKYIGKVASHLTRQIIHHEIFNYFNTLGYFGIDIKEGNHKKNKNLVDLRYNISIKDICLISKIELPFTLPDSLTLNIKVGEPCKIKNIKSSIIKLQEELLSKGYQKTQITIKKLQKSADNRRLTIKVSGKLGRRTSYKVTENLTYFSKKIIDKNALNYLNEVFSDQFEARNYIFNKYTEAGFPLAEIDGPTTEKTKNKDTHVFSVVRGDQFTLGNINFLKNKFFSHEQLQNNFNNLNLKFTEDSINSKTQQVLNKTKKLYSDYGFWSAQLSKSHTTLDRGKKTLDVYIKINEGPQRIFRKLTVSGNKKISSRDLRKMFNGSQNKPLLQQNISNFKSKLKDTYYNYGFLYSSIKFNYKENKIFNKIYVDLDVHITEGPVVYIGAISTQGNVFTKDEVIKKRFAFSKGQAFNQKLINDTRLSLIKLGLFSSVQIKWLPRSSIKEDNIIDIFVKVTEGLPGHLSFSPGFNLQKGFQFSSKITYNNLFGTNRQLTIRGSISEERHQKPIVDDTENKGKLLLGKNININYIEPNIFGLTNSGSISINHREEADNIWKFSDSIEISLINELIQPYYKLDMLTNKGSVAQQDSLVSTGDTKISAIGIRLRVDKRNNRSWPTSGFYLQSEVESSQYFLQSEFNYLKLDLIYSHYFNIFESYALAVGFKNTSYNNIKRKVTKGNLDLLPANNRLLSGGPNDVRGFKHQLGPYILTSEKINGVQKYNFNAPLGGTHRFILKTEIRHKISEAFGTSIFYDIGNSFLSEEETKKFTAHFNKEGREEMYRSVEENYNLSFKEFLNNPIYLFSKSYHAVGFSANLLTPLGALNFAIAWPVKEPKSEKCISDKVCFSRVKNPEDYLNSYKLELNIGSNF